jgi:hypothetical protein
MSMTEQEWLTCTDPRPMLEFLRGKASERKLRLFAVACCRLVLPHVPDQRCEKGLQIAEQYADGLVSEQGRLRPAEQRERQQFHTLAFG